MRDYELEAKVAVLEQIIHDMLLPIWRGFTPEDVRRSQIESLNPVLRATGDSNVDKGRAELVARELKVWIDILNKASQPFPGDLLALADECEDEPA